jgi:hypothetical protein
MLSKVLAFHSQRAFHSLFGYSALNEFGRDLNHIQKNRKLYEDSAKRPCVGKFGLWRGILLQHHLAVDSYTSPSNVVTKLSHGHSLVCRIDDRTSLGCLVHPADLHGYSTCAFALLCSVGH